MRLTWKNYRQSTQKVKSNLTRCVQKLADIQSTFQEQHIAISEAGLCKRFVQPTRYYHPLQFQNKYVTMLLCLAILGDRKKIPKIEQ